MPLLVPQVAFLFGLQVLLVRLGWDGTVAAVAAPARLAGLGAPTMGLKGAVVVTVKSEALLTSTLPVVDVVAGQRAMVLGDVDVVTGSSSTAPAAMPARSQAVAPGTT